MTAPTPQDTAGDTTVGDTTGLDRTTLLVAALASAGAGLVHAAAAGSHNGDRTLAALFAAVAAAQLGWAALAAWRPRTAVAAAGIALNGAAVVAWVLSRRMGLPVIESLREVEAVGPQDLAAAVLGAAAVVAAAAAVALGRRPATARVAMAPLLTAAVLVTALALPGMAAPHQHGAGDDHGHAAGDDHGDDHGTAAPAAHAGMDHDHAARRITSLDDPRLTPEQRRRAQDLLIRTNRAMDRFPDVAAVTAAGYESIGDASSGVEHFINHTFLHDGVELDPDRIEAVVVDTEPGSPKTVAAAMYVLEEPKRMGDEPDIAGSLTTWHLHSDLCWGPSGKRVVGLLRMGRCIPGGTLQETTPMLHVWNTPQPCGPFAEAELLENPIDQALGGNTTTTRPPDADPCQHVHNGH